MQEDQSSTDFVTMGPLPEACQPEFRDVADNDIIPPSTYAHLNYSHEFSYPPVTASYSDIRDFKNKTKLYFPIIYGFDFGQSCILRREIDKFIITSRGLEGIVFDRQGFSTQGSFILQTNVELPRFVKIDREEILFDFSQLQTIEKQNITAIVFADPHIKNYYHWWAECVLSLVIMSIYTDIPRVVTIFNGSPALSDEQKQVVKIIGFEIKEIDTSYQSVVRVREVFSIGNLAICYAPAIFYQRIRETIVSKVLPDTESPSKIYIRRAGSRAVANSEEIETYLISLGFFVVVAESYSQFEQIKMFGNADILVSAHGAGLTNMLFMKAGSCVIELMPNFEVRTFYWLLAQKLHHKYGVVMCQSREENFDSTITVDLNKLISLLNILHFHSGY